MNKKTPEIEIDYVLIDAASLCAIRDCLVNLSNSMQDLLFEVDTELRTSAEEETNNILQRMSVEN